MTSLCLRGTFALVAAFAVLLLGRFVSAGEDLAAGSREETYRPVHQLMLLSQAAPEGRIEANGTWQSGDGMSRGEWRLAGPWEPLRLNTWRVPIVVTESTANTQDASSRARIRGFHPRPVMLDASLQAGVLELRRVHEEGAGAKLNAGALVTESDDDVLPFATSAWAFLKGVRIEGEFTAPDGRRGSWEGWWHMWRNRHPISGLTDSQQ